MSWPRLKRLAMPNLPTVKAMAPKAPSGARRMTMATMRNRTWETSSTNRSTSDALGFERRERHAEKDGEEQHLEDVARAKASATSLGMMLRQEIDGAERVAGGGVARDSAGVELSPGRRSSPLPAARPSPPAAPGRGAKVVQHLEVDRAP